MAWDPGALRKSVRDVWLAGVCGGLGEHTPLPAWAWRAIFIVTGLAGWRVIAYIVLWILMPAGIFVPPAAAAAGSDGDSAAGTGPGGTAPP